MSASMDASLQYDLVVVGSGAGGLSTAVTAAHLGLSVIVLEKEACYGGTTAWSGGWMWIPGNPLAVAAGIHEPTGQALAYLRHELGEHLDEDRARAFLANGPRMVDFFRRHTALQFIDGNAIPDFHGNSPGAAQGGRSVCAAPFDGRRLGAQRKALKSPPAETTLWGMGIASGAELRHFLQATRRLASFWYVARRVAGHLIDLLRHGHSQRLVNGHALVAALATSALEKGVVLRTGSPVKRLVLAPTNESQRVVGVVVAADGGGSACETTIHARLGVILACGGFPHDLARKQQLLPHAPTGREHWSAAARGNTGDGLRMGEQAGGQVSRDLVHAAALAPVSLVPRAGGEFAHFPHLIERAKPGLIAVRNNGRRFCNEANSYYDFVSALIDHTPPGEAVQAWLICDHRFIRRYGLGAVKPAPMPLTRHVRSGYLVRAHDLGALARICGLNAEALTQTVARYNTMARAGHDDDYAKGETPYNRVQGDASSPWPNPCMAALQKAPFYAVRVVPGSLGTFAGLRVNAQAQVLDDRDQAIAGLYAAGNDMSSMMGGRYPSGGITLGPAMTFGYLAAHHAAGKSPE